MRMWLHSLSRLLYRLESSSRYCMRFVYVYVWANNRMYWFWLADSHFSTVRETAHVYFEAPATLHKSGCLMEPASQQLRLRTMPTRGALFLTSFFFFAVLLVESCHHLGGVGTYEIRVCLFRQVFLEESFELLLVLFGCFLVYRRRVQLV